MAVVGLLVAAGSGDRLGAGLPKAFVECAGRPLLDWGLDALSVTCDRVVVAVPPGFEDPTADRVTGAASRSGSVREALRAAPEARIAVVHDAARPLATAALVERCVDALGDGWDGAVAAAPATDTLKEAPGPDHAVVRTLDRGTLWAVQTPQAFVAEALRGALEVGDAALAAASDDAALVEAAGGRVRIVESPDPNLKVTTALDLRIAEEALLARRGAARSRDRSVAPGAGARAHA